MLLRWLPGRDVRTSVRSLRLLGLPLAPRLPSERGLGATASASGVPDPISALCGSGGAAPHLLLLWVGGLASLALLFLLYEQSVTKCKTFEQWTVEPSSNIAGTNGGVDTKAKYANSCYAQVFVCLFRNTY